MRKARPVNCHTPEVRYAVKERIDPQKLSREYVIEHRRLTILSRDYVVEHGVFWDDAELNWDESGYYTVDREGIRFTGLAYEVYDHKDMMYYPFYNTDFQDGTLLHYTYYVNGLHDGATVDFYPSGAVQSYSFYAKGRLTGKSYEWYENGAIKKLVDIAQDKRILFDPHGKITKSECV